MSPEDLLEILYVAANAQTDEEKARIAWRASDYLWWKFPEYPLGFCRGVNDLCPKKPWVKNLWDPEERKKYMKELMGVDLEKLGA
jgi:hypothetical protein